ncbi:MAG: hypothetical protein ABJC39_07750 [Chloroflexota bacterium]
MARDWERALFERCRRAWDFSARSRRNLAPIPDAASVDLDRAIHEALAVYYFPGMWAWDRAIVRPLTVAALRRSLASQAEQAGSSVGDAVDGAFGASREQGEALLETYFGWASTADRFEPIRVQAEFDVSLPGLDDPDHDLTGPDGTPVRYRGRIDALILDEAGALWLMDHRITSHATPVSELILDDDLLSKAVAWQRDALATRVAGTVYNELQLGASPGPAVADEPPPEGVVRTIAGPFRRTWVPRDEAVLAAAGDIVGRQSLEMTDPEVAVYPSPGPDICPTCPYLTPCTMMFRGVDPEALLATHYAVRSDSEVHAGRLGSVTWSIGRGAAPPRFGRSSGGQPPG